MRVAVIHNETLSNSEKVASDICQYADSKGVYAIVVERNRPLPKVDVLISLGGDGSILMNAHAFLSYSIPILGINLGHLGFMADVPLDDLYGSLDDLFSGRYTIEDRIAIETTIREKTLLAFNDVVIHRSSEKSLIELSLFSGKTLVNTFLADGMVISTPNGSTAYSLAAGGPILTPDLEAFVITPICPHTISNRPIVVSSSSELSVIYGSQRGPIEVVADGLYREQLNSNESIHMRSSSKTFKLLTLNRRDYYSTLRTKLHWSGKLRSEL